jgi:hypothetical protein
MGVNRTGMKHSGAGGQGKSAIVAVQCNAARLTRLNAGLACGAGLKRLALCPAIDLGVRLILRMLPSITRFRDGSRPVMDRRDIEP